MKKNKILHLDLKPPVQCLDSPSWWEERMLSLSGGLNGGEVHDMEEDGSLQVAHPRHQPTTPLLYLRPGHTSCHILFR